MADIKVRIHLNNGEYLDIDKRNGLKSVESISQSTGQPKEIFYGIIANKGSVEIIDVNNIFYSMLQNGQIANSNMSVEIFTNGTIVSKHITTDSNYDNNSKIFSFEMTNDINNWGIIPFAGISFQEKEKNLYDILKIVIQSFGFTDLDLMIDENLYNRLTKIKIPFPYLKEGSYKEVIEKICTVGQMQMFLDNTGFPKFVDARPNIYNNDKQKTIAIPKKLILGNVNKNIILKNKFDAINIKENIVIKILDENGNCGSIYIDNINGYESETSVAQISRTLDNGITYEMKLKLYYKSFIAKLPIKTNRNLNTAITLKDFSSTINIGNNILVDDIKKYEYYVEDLDQTIYISPDALEQMGITGFDKEKIKSVEYDETNENFIVNFIACVGRDSSVAIDISNPIETQEYRAVAGTFTFSGKQLKVEFEESDVSSENINNAKTIATIKANELLQSGSTIDSNKVSEEIKSNILTDYKDGISTAKLKLCCADMYYSNGTLAKNWLNGQILDVDDYIYIEGDLYDNGEQRYWKVTGREFEKQGVPKLNVELQEVKPPIIPKDGGLYSDSTYKTKIKSWDKLLENGDVIVSEDGKTVKTLSTNVDGFIKFNSEITEISSYACEDCFSLKGFDLNNVQIIGNYAFKNCTNITNINIGDNVKSVGNYAFNNCIYLTDVTISNGVTEMGSVFKGCIRLSNISLPLSLTYIHGTFEGCIFIREINLPENLTEIGAGTFARCENLTSIEIPAKVHTIGEGAFESCNSLESAIFKKLTGWNIVNYGPIDVVNPIAAASYLRTYLDMWENEEL